MVVLLGANGRIKTIRSSMQKLSNEEIKLMYDKVTELRNQVQTELDTLSASAVRKEGCNIALLPFPEAKEREMLKGIFNDLTVVRTGLNTYYSCHNHFKNIWDSESE